MPLTLLPCTSKASTWLDVDAHLETGERCGMEASSIDRDEPDAGGLPPASLQKQ